MSFSSEIKQELSKINNLKKKEELKYELLGYLISSNPKVITRNKIKYSTENEYNINRFSKILTNLKIQYKIEMDGNLFVIIFKAKDIDFIEIKENKILISHKFLNSNNLENENNKSKNSKEEEHKLKKENRRRQNRR